MNKNANARRAIFCWVLAFSGLPAQAAPQEEPRPSAPYVSPVPENFGWVMKIKPAAPPADGQSAQPLSQSRAIRVKELQYTQVKDLRRVVITMTSGESREYYDFRECHLMPADQPGKIFVIPDHDGPPPYSYYATGFYGLDWVKPGNYAGLKKYKETKCFYYRETGSIQPWEAWIDAETQFPVALKKDGELFEFERTAVPATLSLPPSYQAAWDEYQKGQARLEALKSLR